VEGQVSVGIQDTAVLEGCPEGEEALVGVLQALGVGVPQAKHNGKLPQGGGDVVGDIGLGVNDFGHSVEDVDV